MHSRPFLSKSWPPYERRQENYSHNCFNGDLCTPTGQHSTDDANNMADRTLPEQVGGSE